VLAGGGDELAADGTRHSFGTVPDSWSGAVRIATLSLLALPVVASGPSRNAPQGPAAGAYDVAGKRAVVYTTADSTSLRLTPADTVVFQPSEPTTEQRIYIFVDPTKTFQTMIGIGGALTDAAAETFAKLPAARQDEVMRAYYDTVQGIGYTLARTNINSCDFSSESYTYVDEGDSTLNSFSVAHDLRYKIPLIKRAMAESNSRLKLFASPWSPPAFMKDNHDMLHGGHLLPAYFHAWALYYTKFIKSYRAAGVPVWGLTIQNEPMATQTWESCIYQPDAERDFLKNYLGPVMVQQGLGDVNIMVWDHNRDLVVQRAEAIFDDPQATKYAWGLGFHWYEDWSGGQQMFSNVALVHKLYPEKHLIMTEGTPGNFDPAGLKRWSLGERYGQSMINDFNSGAEGWTDWNILLDEKGGPNHVGNFCFAPIHGDTRTGQLIYTNSYYYIGHFSKFIRPGAKRILASPSRSMLLTTAFLNPDGTVAVVVMNPTDHGGQYHVTVGATSVEIASRPHSIQTVVF
jgi:glucosylceramidase